MLIIDRRREPASIRDLAESPLALSVSLFDNRDPRAENHKVLCPRTHTVEPALDVGTVDVVLHHRRETRDGVLRCHLRREAVPKIQQATCLVLVASTDVFPSAHGPPVELPAAHMGTARKTPSKQIGDRRLSRRLSSRHQPDSRHPNSMGCGWANGKRIARARG